MAPRPRILIVSENISMEMGGEASIPYYYAKLLSDRGAAVWLATHERVAREIRADFPEALDRIVFAEDTRLMKLIYRVGKVFPYRIRDSILGQLMRACTQLRIRQIAARLIREQGIEVIFEPTPVMPKSLSYLSDLGIPLVVGPLNGGMDFPPAFRREFDSAITRWAIGAGRRLAPLVHRLVPGKLRADILMVANQRTAEALPPGCLGEVIRLPEIAVDLSAWSADEAAPWTPGRAVRFVFSGRFVDWKGIKYLVRAFRKVVERCDGCELHLIGGGDLLPEIQQMVVDTPMADRVRFHGWQPQREAVGILRECDVFVMPSLRECGGIAILEAMALGKPVVATNWGGPSDIVNESCGILVDPSSEDAFVDGLAEAMVRLAQSEDLRTRLGRGGRERVRQNYFDWDSKADRILEILTAQITRGKRATIPANAEAVRVATAPDLA